MRAALPPPPPDQVTVRTWPFFGDPLDQDESGTCVAHAGAHAIHCGPISHRKFLDRWALYRLIVTLDEFPDNDHEANEPDNNKLVYGSSGLGGAKALEKMGLISEYKWALGDLNAAIAWVLTRGPVMVGTNWYSSMFTPTPEGLIKISPGSHNAGGHEYLWRGVDMRRGLAEIVNSWGPQWNAHATGRWGTARIRPGHAVVPLEVLERLIVREDGDAVSIIEKK